MDVGIGFRGSQPNGWVGAVDNVWSPFANWWQEEDGGLMKKALVSSNKGVYLRKDLRYLQRQIPGHHFERALEKAYHFVFVEHNWFAHYFGVQRRQLRD